LKAATGLNASISAHAPLAPVGTLICSPIVVQYGKKWRTTVMAKTEMIRARVEPDLKHDAETVFSKLGLSPTEAITLFYKQVTLQHGLPFEVRIPNTETLEAMRQAREKDGLTKYDGVDDLMADFDNA
tara:strand:- start:357 stop:740 length:384 start_codon:yes stop_codon:yes gene_type:complete